MPQLGPSLALALAASLLIATGILQLSEPAFVGRIRENLGYPLGVFRSAAMIKIFAALFLIIPNTRIWGVAAAVGLTAATCVIFFFRGRPLWCVPAALFLGVLGVATLTIS